MVEMEPVHSEPTVETTKEELESELQMVLLQEIKPIYSIL